MNILKPSGAFDLILEFSNKLQSGNKNRVQVASSSKRGEEGVGDERQRERGGGVKHQLVLMLPKTG